MGMVVGTVVMVAGMAGDMVVVTEGDMVAVTVGIAADRLCVI